MANNPPKSAPASISPSVTYRDTRFTSRTLCLPDGRQVLVVRAQVTVEAADDVAMTYLEKHPDMQRQE